MTAAQPSFARRSAMRAIRAYQLLTAHRPPTCRYEPSCSHYAEAAIRARGAAVGSALAAWRVLRCNPFSRGGRDEPPARAPEYDTVVQSRESA